MQWVIARQLHDPYGICEAADVFWEQPRAAEDWSILADALVERLNTLPSTRDRADFSGSYFRDQVSNWAITALQHAGRESEILPLCEREAELNGSYGRLVRLLIDAGRLAEAEAWIVKGITTLDQTLPGTGEQLRIMLRELREQAEDWPRVAAMRAEDFFRQPSTTSLLPLREAAERAGVWPAVRAAALHYLETGEQPQATERIVGDRRIPPWPLPETGLPRPAAPRWPMQFPLINVLIELAVDERRPDEVLRWYDRRRIGGGIWSPINDNLVADAVADAYPDRAIAIWKKLAEDQIGLTQTRAYEVAVGFLRKMGRVMEPLGRADEWRRYIAQLRQTHARKRRLVEMLDNLVG